MSKQKTKSCPVASAQTQAAADLRRAFRAVEQTQREADERARVASLPVRQEHAAGIDVGDASHWVCVAADGGDAAAPKAITATAHKLARILYNLMRHGLAYVKKTEETYAAEVRERQERQLQRRAERAAGRPDRDESARA